MKDADTGHLTATLMLMDGRVPAWKLHTQAFGLKSHIDKPFLLPRPIAGVAVS